MDILFFILYALQTLHNLFSEFICLLSLFHLRDENPWVTVEPNGAVRVKKKWDYEELGREKTIDFWVIITNSGSGGRPRV